MRKKYYFQTINIVLILCLILFQAAPYSATAEISSGENTPATENNEMNDISTSIDAYNDDDKLEKLRGFTIKSTNVYSNPDTKIGRAHV